MAESRGFFLLENSLTSRVVTAEQTSAVVKQGVKIPVVTTVRFGWSANHHHVEGLLRLQLLRRSQRKEPILLNVAVENSLPDSKRRLGGNPTLITKQATLHQVSHRQAAGVIGGVGDS